MKVTRGETRIEFPHLDGTLEAIHPFLRGTYFQLASQIPNEQRPNTSETISLIHDAYENPEDDKEELSSEIKNIMKNRLFYTFNGILYVPKEGVLFQYNPEFSKDARTSDDLIMDKNNLMSKLGSREENGIVYGEGGIRFLKGYDFKIEFQKSSDLAKNPFVIALAGENSYDEGLKQADKLAYIANQYKEQPYICVIKNPNQLVKRVASVYSIWYDDRLILNGYHGIDDFGCSFRVVRSQKILKIFPGGI